MSLARLLKDFRFRIFYGLFLKRRVPLITLGTVCKWTIVDNPMGAASNILCAGAGHDISFEKALIDRYGCRVILLDPSPTGAATVHQANIAHEHLKFMSVGLAGADGIMSFDQPENPEEGSFREPGKSLGGSFQFQCKSIPTLMSELGWNRIDLLKMDIEGFEYGVIRSIFENELDIQQICVEFHYGAAFSHSRSEMIGDILKLRRAGHLLVHHVDRDHTFFHARTK